MRLLVILILTFCVSSLAAQLSINEVCKELNLGNSADHPDVMKEKGGINWFIQGVCATTGDGLYEGLDWIHQKMKKK